MMLNPNSKQQYISAPHMMCVFVLHLESHQGGDGQSRCRSYLLQQAHEIRLGLHAADRPAADLSAAYPGLPLLPAYDGQTRLGHLPHSPFYGLGVALPGRWHVQRVVTDGLDLSGAQAGCQNWLRHWPPPVDEVGEVPRLEVQLRHLKLSR